MNDFSTIIAHLLEADEDELSVKDVQPEEPVAGKATVTRHGRWKIVDMKDYTFLISYLTPVAYLDKATGTYYQTKKQWSPTTNGHIRSWQQMIWKSPEHQANQDNWEPSEYNPGGHYVRYPTFHRKRQDEISGLFKTLMKTMEMKPHLKRRLYHVDPVMRQGSPSAYRAGQWVSGHGKHHSSGEQGLPKPSRWSHEPDLEKFFADFTPDEPEIYDWQGSGYRSQEPHEDE
jgi:hypothetical protein